MSELSPLASMAWEKPLQISRDIGKPGRLAFIKLDALVIDKSYQRPVMDAGMRNIRRIAEEFNWAFFAPLVVAPRSGGKFAVIDGQHKATAAKARGDIKELPCLIIEANHATQAKAFSIINGQVTRLHSLHVFRARVAAGDPTAREIARICAHAGVRICPYPKPAETGETLAAGTLEFVHKTWGPGVLESSLQLLMAAGGGDCLLKASIHGAAITMVEHPTWAKSKLKAAAEALKDVGVKVLIDRALRRQIEAGQREYTCFSQELTELLEAKLGKDPAMKTASARPKPIAKPKGPSDEDRQRAAEAHRLTMQQSPKAPPKAKVDEQALIREHLATKGVRRFESGDTADDFQLCEWLRRRGFDVVRMTMRSTVPFKINGKIYTREQFLQLVDAERKKEKLPPIGKVQA